MYSFSTKKQHRTSSPVPCTKYEEINGKEACTLGIVLISSNITCKLCGSSLLSRADRSSQITIYTLSRGTINGTHYKKNCSKFRSGFSFVQHYGHYSKGKGQEVFFDEDWQKHTCSPPVKLLLSLTFYVSLMPSY